VVLFTISKIPSVSISLKLYFSALAGPVQVIVYSGIGTTGTQLASGQVSYTSPAAAFNLSGVATGGMPGDVTITVNATGAYASPRDLFSIDSIGYAWTTYTLGTSLYTTCGNPADKYEFGYNGQMKMNEIAGIGNHYGFMFREYDPRIGRFWSIDPLRTKYPWVSNYVFAENDVISCIDLEGLEKYLVTTKDDGNTRVTTVTRNTAEDAKPDRFGYVGEDGKVRLAQQADNAQDEAAAKELDDNPSKDMVHMYYQEPSYISTPTAATVKSATRALAKTATLKPVAPPAFYIGPTKVTPGNPILMPASFTLVGDQPLLSSQLRLAKDIGSILKASDFKSASISVNIYDGSGEAHFKQTYSWSKDGKPQTLNDGLVNELSRIKAIAEKMSGKRVNITGVTVTTREAEGHVSTTFYK
jgi:RHS repeat-associated protein